MTELDSQLLRYNCQPYSAAPEIIRAILNGEDYQGVIGDAPLIEYQTVCGLRVASDFAEAGINEAYLSTSIVGKHVFAPLVGCYGGIPCNTVTKMLVQETAQLPEGLEEYRYKEIDFGDETVVADIYKNAWKYRYDEYLDKYVSLPEQGAKQQLAKFLIAKEISNRAGDPYERLADYGRIILFILSKVQLTETEQTQLAPLLTYAPTLTDINEVLYREEQVQARVKNMKENFNGYIGLTDEQQS